MDRPRLLELHRQGSALRFLDAAWRWLERAERDPEIALLAIRALAEAGLGGPARELLQSRTDLDDVVDVPALRRSLSAIPIGRVPWDEGAEAFERGWAALVARDGAWAARAVDVRAAMRDGQLFRTADGSLQVSRRRTGGLRAWVPALGDHAADQAETDRAVGDEGGTLVIGLLPTDLVERAAGDDDPSRLGPRPPVLVVEPCLLRLAAWLHAADRAPLVARPAVELFAGPSAVDDLERFLGEQDDVAIPRTRVRCHADDALAGRVRDACRRVGQARIDRSQALEHRIAQRDAVRDDAALAARLRPGATIVGFTCRFTTMLQYAMRDIGAALRALGYGFEMVMERADHASLTSLRVHEAMWRHDPALVILLNHVRAERPGWFGRGPLLTWIQDPVPGLLCAEAGACIGPRDFVCGYYGEQCVETHGYPEARFFRTGMAVCDATFHDAPLPEPEGERLACDMIYVGHRPPDPEAHVARWRSTTDASLRPLLDDLEHAVRETVAAGAHFTYPERRLAELARARGLALRDVPAQALAHQFAYRLFDALYRVQALEWAAAWARGHGRTLRIHGRGWDDHPTLAPFARPPIEHGEPLRRAYRAARLALQPIPSGFYHQRSFEALASGTLVLARYFPYNFADLSPEAFDRRAPDEALYGAATDFPGLSRVVFRDAEELAARAEAYLDDEPARTAVAGALRAVVLERFTYRAVLAGIIERIRASLAGAAAPIGAGADA